MEVLRQIELTSNPAEIGDRVHRTVRQVLGSSDPYREAKKASTRQALALYPRLKELVAEADDPLDTVFSLLQAKCPVIAGGLGVPLKSIVLKRGAGPHPKEKSVR